MVWDNSNCWHRSKTWNETAFTNTALAELTTALGMRLVISELDEFEEPDPDISLVDPRVVSELRNDWLTRAYDYFPNDWRPVIKARVASAENFYLALISHLDQVRFAIKTPLWIRATRCFATALALLTVAAVVLAIVEPFGTAPTHAFIIAAEFFPITAAVLGLISAIGRERFRSRRALTVAGCVRQELRAAITHGFGRPITEVSEEMPLLSQLSLDSLTD